MRMAAGKKEMLSSRHALEVKPEDVLLCWYNDADTHRAWRVDAEEMGYVYGCCEVRRLTLLC